MAWTKSSWSAGGVTAARSPSLSEIMREQQDEQLARSLVSAPRLSPALPRPPPASDDTFERELALALELSRSEHTQAGASTDRELAERLQEEEMSEVAPPGDIPDLSTDERIAKLLQQEEQLAYGRNQAARKELSAAELLVFSFPIDADDSLRFDGEGHAIFWDSDEEDEAEGQEEDSEYDYTEPLAEAQDVDPDDPETEATLLYDGAQRREDRELAHVTKRDPCKRVNAAALALHHRNYETRNRGKLQAERYRPFDASRRAMRGKIKAERIQLPWKKPEEFAFGLVEAELGGNNFSVYTFCDGRNRLCRLTRSLAASRSGTRVGASSWISKGNVVVVRMRSYLTQKGDILLRISDDEYRGLPRLWPLLNCDPARRLPPELMFRIFDFLPVGELGALDGVGENWKALYRDYRFYRLGQLSDRVVLQAAVGSL